jgi:hypothetical protein
MAVFTRVSVTTSDYGVLLHLAGEPCYTPATHLQTEHLFLVTVQWCVCHDLLREVDSAESEATVLRYGLKIRAAPWTTRPSKGLPVGRCAMEAVLIDRHTKASLRQLQSSCKLVAGTNRPGSQKCYGMRCKQH